MPERKLWIVVVGLAIAAAYFGVRLFQLEAQLGSVDQLRAELGKVAANSVQSIQRAEKEAHKSLGNTVSSHLTSVAKSVSDEQARILEERLKRLHTEVASLEAESKRAKSDRDRAIHGLPEHVELDKLNDYYVSKWKQDSGSFRAVETFNTAQGPIQFSQRDCVFAYLSSPRRLAWLKMGKSAVTENAQLIKAWLEEAARAKVQLGYVRQYRTTKPSDYGEITESLYRKGDMYFKTYFQYERVQGTYKRHSLQYTYYVETGSDARRKQFELEQYNKKLGS